LGRTEKARREFELLASNDFDDFPRSFIWAINMVFLTEVCVYLGDERRAAALYRLMLPYAGQHVLGSSAGPCWGSISRSLGLLATTTRRWDEATRHFEMSLLDHERIGGHPWLARAQYDFARMLLTRGESRDRRPAAELLVRALASARSMEMVRLAEQAQRLMIQFDLGRFGTQSLGESSQFEDRAPARDSKPDRLSDREMAVLRLLASGKSNREIAEELVLSIRTVEHHVAHVYAKIGAHSRVDATTYALRQGVVPTHPTVDR
jgi:DNA-binding NarL/FixJ family response regulator